MKNNHLILIDLIVGFILLPFCILIRLVRKLFSKIFPKEYHGVLVIKFLGAGNFVALQDAMAGKEIEILSAKSNRNALEKFGIGKRVYLIDDSHILSLILSAIKACVQVSLRNYEQVINLETESSFAKFMAAITSSRVLSGVSNTHKSYIDFYLYDRYLVNPTILSKAGVMCLLLDFKETENPYIQQALLQHRKNFIDAGRLSDVRKVIVSPTSSDTDSSRRLVLNDWRRVFSTINSNDRIDSIEVVFSSKNDEQFCGFLEVTDEFPKVEICITSYDEFISKISKADLVITVDSQALHVAQQFHIPTIAFFGPTSPFGVNFKETTYPVSKSLSCSPCFHKYLKLPCDGRVPCMRFDDHHFDVFSLINDEQDRVISS